MSRRLPLWSLVMTLIAVLAYWQARSAVVFNFTLLRPQVRVGYPEIAALIAAVMSALMFRPRMWWWDRGGGVRGRVLAAGVTLLGCLAPVAIVAVSLLAIPEAYRGAWHLTNALWVAAVVFALAPIAGPGAAGALIVLGYFARAIAINLWTDLRVIPLATDRDVGTAQLSPHWLAACLFLVVALVINALTRGLSPWGYRLTAGAE